MTDEQTIDESTKLAVRDALLAHLTGRLRSTSDDAEAHRQAGQLDQDITLESDDTSHSDEAGDLEGLLDDNASRQREAAEGAEKLDFSSTDRVRAGAVVGFDGQRYVVGVATGPFECGGHTYEGISGDSPVFAEIEGRQVGDTVTVAGRELRIDLVA